MIFFLFFFNENSVNSLKNFGREGLAGEAAAARKKNLSFSLSGQFLVGVWKLRTATKFVCSFFFSLFSASPITLTCDVRRSHFRERSRKKRILQNRKRFLVLSSVREFGQRQRGEKSEKEEKKFFAASRRNIARERMWSEKKNSRKTPGLMWNYVRKSTSDKYWENKRNFDKLWNESSIKAESWGTSKQEKNCKQKNLGKKNIKKILGKSRKISVSRNFPTLKFLRNATKSNFFKWKFPYFVAISRLSANRASPNRHKIDTKSMLAPGKTISTYREKYIAKVESKQKKIKP